MISRSVPHTPSARVRAMTAPSERGGSGMSSRRAEQATPGRTVIARIWVYVGNAQKFPSRPSGRNETVGLALRTIPGGRAMEAIGLKQWAIAEGYIPAGGIHPCRKDTSLPCGKDTSLQEARSRIAR